jgi:NarL family two-component system response regulator LiaR
LRNQSATTRVLVLSSFADDAQVFAAVQAGAAGYLLKDVRPDDLAAAIRQVHAGRTVLHPDAAARLVERTQEPAARFTGRERDVLKLLTEGFANKEIARRLLISEKTVKTHVSNILQKLGVQDRTQAAVIAVRQRLVD